MTTIYVHVTNGIVDNRAIVDNPDAWPHEDWIAEETAQIGWTYDGTDFAPPPAPPPDPPFVPHSITKLQLVRQLRLMGREAEFDAALAAAPAQTQKDWGLAVEITRDDPLVVGFAAALGITDADIDAIFLAASQINGG